mmetsp:Transcript_95704/g.310093  ORF Transcript_95704/g.310093 Transcript_95704/m.310093 type:complete len:209 (-) Transcript_95704:118-744(-)
MLRSTLRPLRKNKETKDESTHTLSARSKLLWSYLPGKVFHSHPQLHLVRVQIRQRAERRHRGSPILGAGGTTHITIPDDAAASPCRRGLSEAAGTTATDSAAAPCATAATDAARALRGMRERGACALAAGQGAAASAAFALVSGEAGTSGAHGTTARLALRRRHFGLSLRRITTACRRRGGCPGGLDRCRSRCVLRKATTGGKHLVQS